MPGKQSSLDAFFGSKSLHAPTVTGKKQQRLDNFFGKKNVACEPKKRKENTENTVKQNGAAKAVRSDVQEEKASPSKRKPRQSPNKEEATKKRRRRVIDDDSDEEEEPQQLSESGELKEQKQERKENGKIQKRAAPASDQVEGAAKPAPSPPKSQQSSPTKSDPKVSSARKDTETVSKPSSESTAAKEAATSTKATRSATEIMQAAEKGQFQSDEEAMKKIPDVWKSSDQMPYSVLCQTFSSIEAITSRLKIQELLTTLFRQIILHNTSADDMYPAIYLCSNSVAPACQNVELGIGDSLLIKAIGEATGTNPSMVKQKYETVGDLGTVAQSFKSKQKTLGGFFTSTAKTTSKKSLTAAHVLAVFREIAQTKGNLSQKLKVDKIKQLLVRATDGTETKYIIRGLQGKLRIGLAESTVLIALAHALALTAPATRVTSGNDQKMRADEEEFPEEATLYMDKKLPVEKRLEAAVSIIKKAYSEVPSYDAILDAALKVPLQELHKSCTLSPGIPVSPMLAKPTKSIQEVLKRLNGQRFTCEYKYDGERAQIHRLPDGTTKVFSRNLLDTSEKYPEVPAFVQEAASSDVISYVMDAEVVAFNNKTGQLVPFQILSTRKKTQESGETAKVQVIVQAFDLMYLNNQSLLRKTLAERRALLHKHFSSVPGKFQFATALDHQEDGDTTVIEEFLDNAVKGQCEGLMVKTLDTNAMYEPSRRSLNWLKLKKDYLDGLGDSVDLCVLGGYHGRGKRTGVYGAYLLACYDTDTEEFQSVCKIGTGFSEEDLKNLAEGLNQHVIPAKSSQYNVSDQLDCDVWFDAVQVWEVKAADLSKSSAHRGAEGKTGEAGRGIGLRFPRFERVRADKRPEEATTSDQILDMYYQQDAIVGGGDDAMDDDGGI